MCDKCNAILEQLAEHERILQKLVTGMEIMSANNRMLAQMIKPEVKPIGEVA